MGQIIPHTFETSQTAFIGCLSTPGNFKHYINGDTKPGLKKFGFRGVCRTEILVQGGLGSCKDII